MAFSCHRGWPVCEWDTTHRPRGEWMNRRTAPRVGFLFGAGVSLAAGMPLTQDLTDLVVEGRAARGGDSIIT